jgi:predicted nucleotidyltransferase
MEIETAIPIIAQHEPEVQAVYLFGSHGTEDERPDSDIDMALLLPFGHSGSLAASELSGALAECLGKNVDLINLRSVNTVFQKEIVMADRRVYCVDQFAADEFEMMVVSNYQKLNEERRGIIEDGLAEGRFVA